MTQDQLARVEAAIRMGEPATLAKTFEPMDVVTVCWAGVRVAQAVRLDGHTWDLNIFFETPHRPEPDAFWERALARTLIRKFNFSDRSAILDLLWMSGGGLWRPRF